MSDPMRANTDPEVTIEAVKLDRDGNVVETVEFTSVEAHVSPGLLHQLREAAREGWRQGKEGSNNG